MKSYYWKKQPMHFSKKSAKTQSEGTVTKETDLEKILIFNKFSTWIMYNKNEYYIINIKSKDVICKINDVPFVVSKHIGIAVVVFTDDAVVIVWIDDVVSVDSGTDWDDSVARNKQLG